VVTGKIDRGVLSVDRRLVATRDYAADNQSSNDKTLIIEHPIRQGWKLVEPARAAETTPAVYRFKGTAPAGKITTLTVREELVTTERVAMLPASVEQLLLYSRTGELPPAVRDAIAKAVQLKQAVVAIDGDIADRTKQLADITAEQDRIRENMKTVAASTEYYTRLLTKLNEQESAIEKLQRERDALVVRRDAARRDLETYLSTLTIAG
jgi:hypothetical protein